MKQGLLSRPADLSELLDRWIAAGVITPGQAERMRADLGPNTPASQPQSQPAQSQSALGRGRRQASLAIEAHDAVEEWRPPARDGW